MKQPSAPRLDKRRAKQFERELFERARAWIPAWGMDDDERDFGRALLKIAARFSSEVAERLDRAGEKMRLGFLDWLAVPAEAARPARLPVVFKLSDSARNAVPATETTRLQIEAAGVPVILETEKEAYLLPGELRTLVGVDADIDAFYLPPPGLSSLAPLEPLPTRWQLKSFASADATKLQLDPESGLTPEMLIELGGQQYRIVKVDKDIVTIDPPLTQDQTEQSIVTKVTAFAPFDDAADNRQEHVLYLGHKELFNIEAAATIEVVGAKDLTGIVTWQYWGKVHPKDEVGWQPLSLASEKAQATSDAIVLEKPKGSMEMLELVTGSESRWIRAIVGSVEPIWQPLRVDAFEIRINCRHGLAPPPSGPETSPIADGMANTTPLVLEEVFFPFGKEPRQFDAFYLGSKEAFSKHRADVALSFEMADTTFTALTAVRGGIFAGSVLAGVAQDGALHLLEVNAFTGAIGKFREREPLRPPPPDGNVDTAPGVVLNRRPPGRLPVWHDVQNPEGFLIATTAGDAVWVWSENSSDRNVSRWISFGNVPGSETSPTALIADLLYLKNTSTLVALRDGQLSLRKWPDDPQWTPVETMDGTTEVVLDAIVPVLSAPVDLLVGVSSDNSLYLVTPAGACSKLSPSDVNASVRPVAVRHGGDLIIALAQASLRDLVMFHSANGEKVIHLDEADAKVLGFEAVVRGGELHFLASVQLSAGGYLASWMPHASSEDSIEMLRAEIPADAGRPDGAPTAINQRVVIPGRGGSLLAADFDLTRRLKRHADVGEAVFTPGPIPVFQPGDLVACETGPTEFGRQFITDAGITPDQQVFYLLDKPFSPGANGALHGFHVTGAFRVGDLKKVGNHGTLKLESGDSTTLANSIVRVGTDLYRVTEIDSNGVATVLPRPAHDELSAHYWSSTPINGRVVPVLRLNAANNNWDAALLDHATLVFAGASPPQQGKAFSVGMGNRPLLIELSKSWIAAPVPAANAAFVLDAAVGPWVRWLGNTSTNPELSWEYWNGTGWWKLDVTRDETLHLKKSGTLQFKVPLDLSATDWSGRTNYWIRARLIGGDYGREKISVATSPPDANGITHQTVERSSRDIHAPTVVKLTISYEICEGLLPTFVLTQDSGSLRDQSDANRTGGAMVEAFVPVAVLLGRLSGSATTPAVPEDCPPECDCPSGAGVATNALEPNVSSTPLSASASIRTSGRALYLGFDAALSGEPVNVLLLVEQRVHDAFAPLTVEALVADQFVPILVSDTTRALGESGILSMAFALEPTRRELFGQTVTWLRLTPAASKSAAKWKPKVLGAYLNAVWASAAETLTYELVGSSQGEPRLTLFLARPPVLHDTLELRVKEPLGEEERDALNAERKNQVLSAVENLPGDWVLWRRVIDPDDEPPTERVYALDEATGEIRFGDGRHGKIPPVGRDSIMAFKYRRTETGAPGSAIVPANTIAARTSLNLVSPVEGVEAVFAADQAAGGSPAEDTDRVLRFGVARLRHRERALTARDIEDLVLESSPDIVQARCFSRNRFVQLVVVMRGADPMPSAAQVRELHRLLLEASPPSLSARQALRIGGPAIRHLRVDLRLRVASLDDAGAVARDARKQIVVLFDTLTGGVDEDGWALGENPTEGDVAMALADVPRLEGLADVALREITADGSDQPWPATLKPTELARLHEDVVRVEFETVEVIA